VSQFNQFIQSKQFQVPRRLSRRPSQRLEPLIAPQAEKLLELPPMPPMSLPWQVLQMLQALVLKAVLLVLMPVLETARMLPVRLCRLCMVRANLPHPVP
jgi:hypothetical protein